MWHVCKNTTHVPHVPIVVYSRYMLSSMHSPTVKERAELSNPTTYLSWHAKDTSITDNLTEVAWTTHVQARGLDKPHRLATLTRIKVATPDIGQNSSTLGGLTNSTPSTCQNYYPKHQTNSLDTGQSISTLDNLFCLEAYSELGGLCTV